MKDSQALLVEIREQLAACSDERFRAGAIQFFRESIDLYGVRSPAVHKIAAAAFRAVKKWPPARRNQFCEALWKSGKFEEGVIVCHLYRRFRSQCASCEFRLFERWIDRFVTNWAHCDGVASWLLSASIENEPALIGELASWTASPNRWKRRAAAVSLLQEAKKGRHTEAIFEIAGLLIEDRDDMVRKGVGWVLKETYPKKPKEVLGFLDRCKGRAPRLVLRLAAEKMTPGDRARAMAR